MANLEILKFPDPRLRTVAKPVEVFDDTLAKLADDMLSTMYEAPGIGLAAVQIGILKRAIVIDISKEDEKKNPIFLINPIIRFKSEKRSVYAVSYTHLTLPTKA